VWFVMRDHLEAVLEQITIERIVSGDLPDLSGPGRSGSASTAAVSLGTGAVPAV
jgi:hypothetical protein